MAELQSADNGLYRMGFAGDTLNTAWYMRALSEPDEVAVEYLTAIGTDQLSQDMRKFLEANGIATNHVREIPDRTIGLYLITLKQAERFFTYWRSNSAAKLLADDGDFLHSTLSAANCIYFSGITLAILSPESRTRFLSILARMKAMGKFIAFDSNTRRKLWSSDEEMAATIVAGYQVSTLALPTFEDEALSFGDGNILDCAKRISSYGVKEIVVKDGAKPCLALIGDQIITLAPIPIAEVVDTTGAGDSFNAGYISARLASKIPIDALKVAHGVAGKVIRQRGALLEMSGFRDFIK